MNIPETRVLTIRWPHVAAIAYPAPGGCVPKRVENRTFKVAYRGTLLIHAGKKWDPRFTTGAVQHAWENAGGLAGIDLAVAEGKILAVAELVDCHETTGSCCLPWGQSDPGVFHWILADVRRLPEPVAHTGTLGLRRPPEGVAAAVAAQLEAVSL